MNTYESLKRISSRLNALEVSHTLDALLEDYLTAEDMSKAPLRIAVIGEFSSGKSTFINSLLGEELCPAKAHPTTTSLTYFRYGEKQSIHRAGKKTKVSAKQYMQLVQGGDASQKNAVVAFDFFHPAPFLKDVVIIDTPGYGNGENENDARVTDSEIAQADVLILISDMNMGSILNKSMRTRMTEIQKERNESAGETVIECHRILNKSDEKKPSTVVKMLKKAQQDNEDGIFTNIHAYSAQDALNNYDGEDDISGTHRDDIVRLFEDIGIRRQGILERKQGLAMYVLGKNMTSELRRDNVMLEKELENCKNSSDMEIFKKQIQELKNRAYYLAEHGRFLKRNSILVHQAPQEEKDYWFNPWYKISRNNSPVFKALKSLGQEINDSLGYMYDVIQVTKPYIEHFKDSDCHAYLESSEQVDCFYDSVSDIYYESKEEADEAKDEACEDHLEDANVGIAELFDGYIDSISSDAKDELTKRTRAGNSQQKEIKSLQKTIQQSLKSLEEI